jgi:DNA-binding MarR family transcriptional regulator
MSINKKQHRSQAITQLGRQYSDITILMHEAIAQKAGLAGTDHKYFGLILEHGTLTAGDVSKITGLTTGAVTGLIDRLEKKQLVKRVFDEGDRRKVLIEPNREKAMVLFGGVFDTLEKKMLKLLSTFNEKELQAVEQYMRSTISLMSEITQNLKQ